MKKINVALINNVQYCKFPKGINNITEFIEFLNENYHSFIELEFLIEEGCVAPFYIEEDLKIEKQYWNPSNIRLVKEAEASILLRWEYEEKLKKVVSEKCVDCVHYQEDAEGDNLKGHREKISLDGECWGYEKKS
ncbi:MAG: hypothetical protein IJE00_06810 [Clostridia bacterium]|nr:hypothetical protein [Clostridia bacterium]